MLGAPASDDMAAREAAVRALFDDSCVMCHGPDSDEVDLSVPLANLVGAKGGSGKTLVVAGDPQASYLLAKLSGQGMEGELMPLGDDPLSAEQLALVNDWIVGLAAAAPAGDGDGDAAGDGDGDAVGDPTGDGDGDAGGDGDVIAPPPPPVRRRDNFFGTHQINQNTTTTLGKKSIEFRIHHRFGKLIAPRSYLGLAGGATMSLGVAYGIVDGLDVLARWSNANLDWELGMKYVPLRQVDGKPLSLGVFASFEALADDPAKVANRFTGNFQFMLSRLWAERWSTQLMFNWSMFTNHTPDPRVDFGSGPQVSEDRRGSLDVGLASTVWLGKKKKHGIDLEYTLPLPVGGSPDVFYFQGGDASPGGSKYGNIALGWSARAGLHLFQVFITNQSAIHTNQVASGPSGAIENGDVYLGFNISRRWKL